MKIIFALLLTLAIVASAKEVKAHFIASVVAAKATFDGYAYFEFNADPIQMLNAKIEYKFDGIVKNPQGEAPCKGTGLIADPFMMNLDNIKFNGDVLINPKVSFNGVCKISILDVIKPKIPFKGKVKLSDGTEAEITGLIDRPNI